MIAFRTLLRRLIRRPSHATVVAYFALFMTMSGTAAATVLWTGANIQDGSLTGADVQDGSLSGTDIQSGSITQSDLAPDTTSGGGTSTTVLGSARNAATVTGPTYSTDPAAEAQTVASVSFTVPAGQSYQVLVASQSVFSSANTDCVGHATWTGESAGVYLDGDLDHSLLGFTNGNLPAAGGLALGGSQALVVGEGTHTFAMINVPSKCDQVISPGTTTYSDSYLSVNLLAVF